MFFAVACCKMGRNKDVTDWQKDLIVFQRSKKHGEEEIVKFTGVSSSTVKCVF